MKPVLKIGKYYHAKASDALADFPMRLARTLTGEYYWSMARSGEYHWWIGAVAGGGGPVRSEETNE